MKSLLLSVLLAASAATAGFALRPAAEAPSTTTGNQQEWWELNVRGVDKSDDHRMSYIATDGEDRLFLWGMSGPSSAEDANATWMAVNASCPPGTAGCSTVLWNMTSQLRLNYQDNFWSQAPLYLPVSKLAVFPTQNEEGGHDGVFLHAFDAATGTPKWVYHRPHCKGILLSGGKSYYKVQTVSDLGDLIIYYNCGSVVAINGTGGVVQWEVAAPDVHVSGFNGLSTPAVSSNGGFAASAAGGLFDNCGMQVYTQQSAVSYKPSWATSIKGSNKDNGCVFQDPVFTSSSSGTTDGSSPTLVIKALALGSTQQTSGKICTTSAPNFCQFNISAFNAMTGALVWTTIQDAYYHYELLETSGGKQQQLLVVGNNQSGAGTPHAVVIDPQTGKVTSNVFLTSKFAPTEPGPNYEGRLQKITPVAASGKSSLVISGFYTTDSPSSDYYRKGFLGVNYQTGEVVFEVEDVTFIHLPKLDYRYQYQGNIALLEEGKAGSSQTPRFATQMGQRGFYYNGTVFVVSP